MMLRLMRFRTKILSGNLPVDEIKDIKQMVTSMIDMGNKSVYHLNICQFFTPLFNFSLLGLDMVVRDDQGNILNPMLTSALQLYHYHDVATKRVAVSKLQVKCASWEANFLILESPDAFAQGSKPQCLHFLCVNSQFRVQNE